MKSIIALFAVLGFVSVANADHHDKAAAPTEHAAGDGHGHEAAAKPAKKPAKKAKKGKKAAAPAADAHKDAAPAANTTGH